MFSFFKVDIIGRSDINCVLFDLINLEMLKDVVKHFVKRCQEKQSLLDHINKYSRHREGEAKRQVPDYFKVLRKSSNPYCVGDEDVIQLSKKESIKWFSRNFRGNPQDGTDVLFEDDEDEIIYSG
jgi:hypothetical protein